jgi:hypothetical protein
MISLFLFNLAMCGKRQVETQQLVPTTKHKFEFVLRFDAKSIAQNRMLLPPNKISASKQSDDHKKIKFGVLLQLLVGFARDLIFRSLVHLLYGLESPHLHAPQTFFSCFLCLALVVE